MRLVVALLAFLVFGSVHVAQPANAGIMVTSIATERPDGQGDQLVFFYDAREGRTSFVTVRHAAQSLPALTVRLIFYSGGFSLPFTRDLELEPGQLRIVDITALRDEGLPAQPGMAIATAIDPTGAPVVTRALTGNFTVANLETGSGWGAAAAARSAINTGVAELSAAVAPPGTLPAAGTVIDGIAVALRPIQPRELDLAAYYAPDQLAPPEQGGNELVFLSFADILGGPYAAQPASTSWTLTARRNDGSLLAGTTYGVSGVVATDIASVVGPSANGTSGSIRLAADETADRVSRLVFFAEALGTVGTGYMLPVPGVPMNAMAPAAE